ncbi:hypothetical protein CVIRNUC_004653 [Coccomyxa viridis]|uniref:Uncharacterized protein n=1 Tax=Coccomyxa viridis TaxID=1274662 RepID=A0AAV1I2X3_9CHLO|nr:hypothetical protein CVIRNUC_004653 [Coccomyxa viridis]
MKVFAIITIAVMCLAAAGAERRLLQAAPKAGVPSPAPKSASPSASPSPSPKSASPAPPQNDAGPPIEGRYLV